MVFLITVRNIGIVQLSSFDFHITYKIQILNQKHRVNGYNRRAKHTSVLIHLKIFYKNV